MYRVLRHFKKAPYMKISENGINCTFLSVGLLESTNQSDWGWEQHVTCTQEARTPHKILIENAKGSTLFLSSRHLFVISLRFIQHCLRICINRSIILKWMFKKQDRGRGLDRSDTGQGQVASCCERGHEISSLIKCGKILDQLSSCCTLRKDCVPWGQLFQ